MKLPNPELAIIDDRKLDGYSLNVEYDWDKRKEQVFKSTLKYGSLIGQFMLSGAEKYFIQE